MRYYEEELEVLIKAGAKVVEVASFEWERVHGFANYVAEDLKFEIEKILKTPQKKES